jgi:hypothetical protein
MEKAEPIVPGEEAAFWERKAKNGRRAAGAPTVFLDIIL